MTYELTEPAQGILNVLNDKKETISSGDGKELVKTGYYLTKEEGEYKIILYGDANRDGIICDTDDVMVIIKDYLGQKNATELEKLAANLDSRDEKLDSDDLIQMINMYLGKLNKDLVVKNIDVVGQWKYYSAMKDGKEIAFNEVFGSSAIGSTGYIEFKEDGTFVNDFPGATSIELENTGKYSLYRNNIKLQFTKESVDLTYNSKDNTISYPYGEYTLILKNATEGEEYLKENWTYSIKSDNTIVLLKYIGKDANVIVKSKVSIDNKEYNLRFGESTGYDPLTGTQAYGPFIGNESINTVTFESTEILEDNIHNLFANCTNLTRVIGFGGNIKDMSHCFYRCTSLLNEKNKNSSDYVEGAEINIPDSVENLDYAFYLCSSMNYLPDISSNSKLKTASNAFGECESAKSGTIYLPETVSEISYMFYNCNMLGYYTGSGFRIYSYMIPDKITAKETFKNCGVVLIGGGGYGSQPHEFIVKNATSETDETFIFFKDLIDAYTYACSLTVKLAQ